MHKIFSISVLLSLFSFLQGMKPSKKFPITRSIVALYDSHQEPFDSIKEIEGGQAILTTPLHIGTLERSTGSEKYNFSRDPLVQQICCALNKKSKLGIRKALKENKYGQNPI